MPIYNSILDTIGNTPIVKLSKISQDIPGTIFAKIEFFNPGSSVKDRPALNMIEVAEENGILNINSEIVEATSGNTGIGLAMVAAAKDYKISIFMPESVSIERKKIMIAYGANVILTPAEQGMSGAIKNAEKYAKENSAVYLTKQFENIANPEIHEKTTAIEIWEDMNHDIDVFISCVGTGGTITGTGSGLKNFNPKIHIIAVEPEKSPVLSGGEAGKHSIEGMGPGFIPSILNTEIYDEIIAVSENEAYSASKSLAKVEGIFVGKTSGAALAAALKYSKTSEKEERIVIILPDTGERYLSTDLWSDNK